jgi:hypothetical protein
MLKKKRLSAISDDLVVDGADCNCQISSALKHMVALDCGLFDNRQAQGDPTVRMIAQGGHHWLPTLIPV